MADESQSVFQLTKTKIKVEGNDDEVIFTNLVINQYLADVNMFSFTWRQEEKEVSLSGHIAFYQKNLSKEVTVTIQGNFIFKGIIYAINCNNQDPLGISYEIIGRGSFVRLDEVPECTSFYKKTLAQIFSSAINVQGLKSRIAPKNTKELFYTVQYNQTRFDFLRMMAARHGEWLYYTGTEMVLGSPATDVINLTIDQDIHDVNITAKLVKVPQKNTGFDSYKGETVNGQRTPAAAKGLMAVCLQAGDRAFGNDQAATHVSQAVTPDLLTGITTLKHQAAAASSVALTAGTHNSKLRLAGRIRLVDHKGQSSGDYIITELHHNCMSGQNYQNQLMAIPADNEVPPYTDPHLFPVCRPQPGVIVNNEDKDGLDRVKVHFPWQPAAETTPWISVLTPHAGKDKGMRFLPEVNEEVMTGFLDNNAEKPYVMGAVHTEKNQSGNKFAKNNLKVLGTKTGRRLEVDDDGGYLSIADNYAQKTPKNILYQKRKDADTVMKLASHKDDENFSNIVLTNEKSLEITVTNGNDAIALIRLEKNGNKITIQSKGNIDIHTDADMTLSAQNITMNAEQELKMEGKMKGVDIKGQKVSAEAQTSMDVKGLNTKVAGNAQLDLKGGGMASLAAALVKIN
jgi:uncharacterized protein involved in type VI secretion and phage assembly